MNSLTMKCKKCGNEITLSDEVLKIINESGETIYSYNCDNCKQEYNITKNELTPDGIYINYMKPESGMEMAFIMSKATEAKNLYTHYLAKLHDKLENELKKVVLDNAKYLFRNLLTDYGVYFIEDIDENFWKENILDKYKDVIDFLGRSNNTDMCTFEFEMEDRFIIYLYTDDRRIHLCHETVLNVDRVNKFIEKYCN